MPSRQIVCLGLGLALSSLHCGAPDDAQPSLEDLSGEDKPGTAAEAINESIMDRPVSAAVDRWVNWEKQTWLFACTSDNVMKRRVRTSAGWGSWWTVNTSFPCATTPTVSIWDGGPTETIAVYWRSTSNKLIAAFYGPHGNFVADLSTWTGFGSIAGRPLVVSSINLSGAAERTSVAVQKPNREVYTFDYYQGAWQVRPVKRSSGATALAYSNSSSFTSYNAMTLAGSYLSFHTDSSYHRVFTRSSWHNSYTEHAYVDVSASYMEGVLGFSNSPTACPQGPCLMMNAGVNYVSHHTGLATGGNLTRNWNLTLPTGVVSSIVGTETWSTYVLVTRRRELGFGYRFDDGWVNTGGSVWTMPNIALRQSGPVLVFYGKANPGGLDFRLYAFDNGGDFPIHLDLGLNVLDPFREP
jgi:hypothetical protein